MILRFKLLHPSAIPPTYGSAGAAGLDLCALEDVTIEFRHTLYPIRTGIAVEIPQGFEGMVRGRSGLAFRHGIFSYNGTIDSDYRGEILALLYRVDSGRFPDPYQIKAGDRVAQLVIAPMSRVMLRMVDAMSSTDRGEGGFGSTGVS